MKIFVKIVLSIINIFLFAIVILFLILGVCDQILGPASVEKLLNRMNIPFSYNQVFIMGFVCTVLMVITYILSKKIFGKM